MAVQDRIFTAGDKQYTLRFTQNALYLLEEKLGRVLFSKVGEGIIDVQTMFWAGLEGARLKYKTREKAFTIFEAGEIIDAAREGGAEPFQIMMDAWRDANPTPKKADGGEEVADPANPLSTTEPAKNDGTN